MPPAEIVAAASAAGAAVDDCSMAFCCCSMADAVADSTAVDGCLALKTSSSSSRSFAAAAGTPWNSLEVEHTAYHIAVAAAAGAESSTGSTASLRREHSELLTAAAA